MKPTIAILAGGGPAPGINTVIGTIAKVFLTDGYRVLGGLHGGFKSLFIQNPEIDEINLSMPIKFTSKEAQP